MKEQKYGIFGRYAKVRGDLYGRPYLGNGKIYKQTVMRTFENYL